MPEQSKRPLKIAIVGGGIAGIMSAYLLQQEHEIDIYESANYLGGHANAVKIDNGIDKPFELDTAFLVFNNYTYPLFIKFVKQIGAFHKVEKSEMSFSFSDAEKDLHFAVSRGFNGYFYQKKNLYNINFHRMFRELMSFRKKAYSDLINNTIGNLTLAEYLKDYSAFFRENMIAPTAAAVWSLPADKIWDFPAQTYINFQYNHRYLNGMGWLSSSWYTFNNGSGEYIRAFLDKFRGKLFLNNPVKKVLRYADHIEIIDKSGQNKRYDKVIFATHADTALKLIDEPSDLEKQLLGFWQYYNNPATLHTDTKLVHKDRGLWASWNVKISKAQSEITYYLNRVQNLKSAKDYFLTLGAAEINQEDIIATFNYTHPVYNFQAIESQKDLPKLNGYLNSYFCGSYFGYGFHEDAVKSAVKVAHRFGIDF